ncbi:MAG TPA: type II toxin-antitoxin system VapC family toxin [Acidimicrobiales bacterium]|nr:type II toxin-antitoxin system VapC family toxin [Acidimicrobiales bacterium]
MRLVDANVLLYAVNEDAPRHRIAHDWLDEALGLPEPVGFAWVVLLAFLRLSTSPAVFTRPLSIGESFAVVRSWLERPAAMVVDPLPRHLAVLEGILAEMGTAAGLVTDAHLAALAIEHRARVMSFDADFERFPGLVRELPPSAE